MLQAGLHGAQVVERMHAFSAGAKFAGSLRAAQQQNAKDGNFVTIKIESFLEAVLVLGDAAVRSADGAGPGDCPSRECKACRTAASSRFMTGSRFDF